MIRVRWRIRAGAKNLIYNKVSVSVSNQIQRHVQFAIEPHQDWVHTLKDELYINKVL